jgi:hypothetical protein
MTTVTARDASRISYKKNFIGRASDLCIRYFFTLFIIRSSHGNVSIKDVLHL